MRKTVPTCDEVRSTIRRWFNPTTLNAVRLRDTLVGVMVTVGLAEVCILRLLHHHIAAGELPPYISDVLIVGYLLLEACVSPLVSWWGYRARRRLLLAWSSILTAGLTAWFLLRTPGEMDTGLCTTSAPSSTYSAAGLVILLASAPVLVSARVAVTSHGLAYIEDHAPERTPLQFSAFVLSRVLPLLVGAGVVTLMDSSMPAQVALLVVGMVVNVVQLMTILPKQDPMVKGDVTPPLTHDRGFSASVSRVVRNPVVTSQVLAASLLAAALWTYGFYRNDVIKVKYNLAVGSDSVTNFTEMLQYSFVILVVAFQAIRLSPPLWARWSRTKGVTYALMTGVLALVMTVVMMIMTDCEPGTMVVEQRNCSLQCGCVDRYVSFSPVCLLDDLTTYPSPCLAGCSDQDIFDGLRVYVNCTCGGRAVAGACGADRCGAAFQLHQMLFVVIAAAVISAMSTHGIVAVRAADARDRAVSLGVGGAALALVLALTHTYLAVATSGMCALYAGGVCVVPAAGLPQLVGVTSVVLLALSCLFSAGVCLRLWRAGRTDGEL